MVSGMKADLVNDAAVDVDDSFQTADDDLRLSQAAQRRDADYLRDYDPTELLKRLAAENGVEKRRFCRQNYVYNPVSGRCQASLLVRI